MNTTFQAPLNDEWVAVVDAPITRPYDDGVTDCLEGIPCTQFRHYSTAEQWHAYTTGYMDALNAAIESELYEEEMLDREDWLRGQW